jgi:transcriptional regulator with PAS, ATPase and Fis domain
MDTLRVFIRWCESVDAVPQNLSEKVLSPSLSKGGNEPEKIAEELGITQQSLSSRLRRGHRRLISATLIGSS